MEAERLLVILLSITLIVVLIIVAVLLANVIKVVQAIRSVADKTEAIADNLVSASNTVRKAATPVVVSRAISNLVEKFSSKVKSKRSKKGGDDE